MSEDNRETAFRNANVRLYRNVVLTGCNCSTVGILFCLNLDQNSLPKSLNWANSRRLIYGNLLAATFDNFASSCFLLTVEDRSNIDKTGTIFVRVDRLKSRNFLFSFMFSLFVSVKKNCAITN